MADRTTPVYEASIAPDGRISGRSNQTNTTLEGQVSGRQINGQIHGLLCYYEFSANVITLTKSDYSLARLAA